MQITKYFKNPNDVKYFDEFLTNITDDRKFDYVFFLDQAGDSSSRPINIIARKGNLTEANLWVVFTYEVDISSCYWTKESRAPMDCPVPRGFEPET